VYGFHPSLRRRQNRFPQRGHLLYEATLPVTTKAVIQKIATGKTIGARPAAESKAAAGRYVKNQNHMKRRRRRIRAKPAFIVSRRLHSDVSQAAEKEASADPNFAGLELRRALRSLQWAR